MKNSEISILTEEKGKLFALKFKFYEIIEKIINWRWQSIFLLVIAAILLSVVFLQMFPGNENSLIKTDLSQNLQSRP
ncbi:MAG TPA: hypothetical protein GX706_00495 [Candidatus Moranbacteria bacterium]|nr:hypothetical protein [Candidatus Moranbacteria bacterium]